MEREILFRGKRMDNGELVSGYLVVANGKINNGKNFILASDADFSYGDYGRRIRIGCFVEVYPSTVGQYTGLTDKNGVKIFEGDIISVKNNICMESYRFIVEFGLCGGVENVEHSVGFPCFFFKEVTGIIPYGYRMRKDPVYFLNAYVCKVIGNIHDNPELMKGNKNE